MSSLTNYDKTEVKTQLSLENVFTLLSEWGGEPIYTNFGLISATICHNPLGEGKHKLYYYSDSHLFNCFSNCGSYDIFELAIKVAKIQKNQVLDLNEAVRMIAARFGIAGSSARPQDSDLDDWKYLANYDRIQDISIQPNKIILKEYETNILKRFNYTVKISPWLNEGITQETIDMAMIGYYPGEDQITIPHFDKEGRFIGLRGRALCEEDARNYGKYRPLKINKKMYNHPLGMNLYGLNWTQNSISSFGKAIVYESEKSVLLHQSYFPNNNMSVACCGSSLTAHQVQLLMDAGTQEIVIAFDRQFQKVGDEEFNQFKNKLLKIGNRFKNYIKISIIFDKKRITSYKASPIDEGPDKFLQLFKERIIL